MKNKKYLIIGVGGLLLIALVTFLIILLNNNNEKETDDKKFAKEYTQVTDNNVFVYRSIEDVIKLMEHGTGVVYLGFPECPWCQSYVKYLNEVAEEVGIDKIYYYNILEDRKKDTPEYQRIVELLGDNLEYDDEGNHRVYVPNVSFHINGEIIGNDFETAKDTKGFATPEEYWTEDEINELKNTLTEYMEEVYTSSNMCTSCNE